MLKIAYPRALPRYNVPQGSFDIDKALAKEPMALTPVTGPPTPEFLERAARLQAIQVAKANRELQEIHRLRLLDQQKRTYDDQPTGIFKRKLLYDDVGEAPVNPYSRDTRDPLELSQHPATAWRRYSNSGDGYSGSNPYKSLGYGALGAGLGGLAGRALFGNVGMAVGAGLGGLLGSGLYGRSNFRYNKDKDLEALKNSYSFGGKNEYANKDPRLWGRYNPESRYDQKTNTDRTDTQQMKNIGGSQYAANLAAGAGGLGGLFLANALGLSGGLGKGLFALAGAGAGLYGNHLADKPGSWFDRNRERIRKTREFLDIESGDYTPRNVREPESYYAEGGY